MSAVELLRRMIEHDARGWRTAIESIERAPDQGSEWARRARAVALHGLAARRAWLARLGGGVEAPAAIFGEDAGFAELDAEQDTLDRAWADFANRLDAAALDRDLEYRSMDGRGWATRADDIISHVCQHGAYHRGQIAMLVRRAGGEPASTDYIFAARRER